MLLVEHSVICLQYSIRHSYLLTKLHVVSKIKEFAYNMLSFVCVFNAIVSGYYKLSTLMLF